MNDIIDDLKVAVVNKYPNTIGRYEDAADLLVKIDLNNIKVPVSPVLIECRKELHLIIV